MKVSQVIDGKRGKKLRLEFSPIDIELGGGVLVEVWQCGKRDTLVASGRLDRGSSLCLGSRLLANWLGG